MFVINPVYVLQIITIHIIDGKKQFRLQLWGGGIGAGGGYIGNLSFTKPCPKAWRFY